MSVNHDTRVASPFFEEWVMSTLAIFFPIDCKNMPSHFNYVSMGLVFPILSKLQSFEIGLLKATRFRYMEYRMIIDTE